jgi:hypothetical protein
MIRFVSPGTEGVLFYTIIKLKGITMGKYIFWIVSCVLAGFFLTKSGIAYQEWGQGCNQCHASGTLHGVSAHSNCSACHTGAPGPGNVSPANCTACHGEVCPLIDKHANKDTCLGCHAECNQGPATTTTTVLQEPCTIESVHPGSVNIGFGLVPRIRKISVTVKENIEDLGITEDDLVIDAPVGIIILSIKISGNVIDSMVMFWGVEPGTYNVQLGVCGSSPLTVSQF